MCTDTINNKQYILPVIMAGGINVVKVVNQNMKEQQVKKWCELDVHDHDNWREKRQTEREKDRFSQNPALILSFLPLPKHYSCRGQKGIAFSVQAV